MSFPLAKLWHRGRSQNALSPVEAPGHLCIQLPGRLAHSVPLQGVSQLLQGCRSPPRLCSWPQKKQQEECSLPFSTNCVFGSSLGFRSDAGPSGSCPDFQPQYMFGPLQARPLCFRENIFCNCFRQRDSSKSKIRHCKNTED